MGEIIEEWFISYSDDVKSFLVYFLGRLDVDDLVQETFLRAIKGFQKFKGSSSPKTWLLTIAKNSAIDALRKNSRYRIDSDTILEELPTNSPSPEDTVTFCDGVNDVIQILQKLNDSYRQVILLRYVMDLSVSETANVLGWTKTRVNVTLHRAIQMIRSQYRTEGGILNEPLQSK